MHMPPRVDSAKKKRHPRAAEGVHPKQRRSEARVDASSTKRRSEKLELPQTRDASTQTPTVHDQRVADRARRRPELVRVQPVLAKTTNVESEEGQVKHIVFKRRARAGTTTK